MLKSAKKYVIIKSDASNLYKNAKKGLKMKKMKSGFTLAEVLITLAIIGVVASLTLPSLMVNTGEQQAMTAYKKLINSLTEAGQLNAAVNGFDYSTMTGGGDYNDDFTKEGKMTLGAILHDQLKISPGLGNVTLGTGTKCAVFTDSTAVCLGAVTKLTGTDASYIIVDTNGTKGPNKLSECDENGCTTKSGRKLYDQYYVTLYQGQAYPGKWSGFEQYNAADKYSYAALYAAGLDKKASPKATTP